MHDTRLQEGSQTYMYTYIHACMHHTRLQEDISLEEVIDTCIHACMHHTRFQEDIPVQADIRIYIHACMHHTRFQEGVPLEAVISWINQVSCAFDTVLSLRYVQHLPVCMGVCVCMYVYVCHG